MSALVQRALREPVRFERDIAGPDRKALEVLVAAGVLKKERQDKITVFMPVVTLAEFRKPKSPAKRENVETWLRKSLAARAFIPVSEGWKETAWAKSHYRIVIDGAPCYFAPYVKDWAPWMKRALCRHSPTKKETAETDKQMDLLFPVQSATRNFGRLLDKMRYAFWVFEEIAASCERIYDAL